MATLLAGRGWIALSEKKYCMTCEIFSAPFMPIPFNRKMKIRRLMIKKRLRIWIFNEHKNRIWFRIIKRKSRDRTDKPGGGWKYEFRVGEHGRKICIFFSFSTSSWKTQSLKLKLTEKFWKIFTNLIRERFTWSKQPRLQLFNHLVCT